MENYQILALVENYIYQKFNVDTTGHDYYHMRRVAKMAKYLAEQEQSDLFLTEVAGWVHDIGDDKLSENPEAEFAQLRNFLRTECFMPTEQIKRVFSTIETVSFRKGKIPETTIGAIVQDADRLDAIGAIGISRAFAYGGYNHQPLYSDEQHLQQNTSIQHFSDKLLLIKDKLNTESARNIAMERHAYMEQFLLMFEKEWNFNNIK